MEHAHSQPGIPRTDTDQGWIGEGLSPLQNNPHWHEGGADEKMVGAKLVEDGAGARETEVQRQGRLRRQALEREMEETGGWGKEPVRGEGERGRMNRANRSARFDIGATAKVYGLRALACIVEIMEDVREPAPVRLSAAKEVLDRGFGKPRQITEIGGLDGDEIRNRLVIEFVAPGVGGVGRGTGPMARGEPDERTIDDQWKVQVAKRAIEDVAVHDISREARSAERGEEATREVSREADRREAEPRFVNPWAKEE